MKWCPKDPRGQGIDDDDDEKVVLTSSLGYHNGKSLKQSGSIPIPFEV